MSLKLVSLNVERSNHTDRVVSFLARTQPEVLCMQEFVEADIPRIADVMGGEHRFVPMVEGVLPREGYIVEGIAIFSRFPIVKHEVHYYIGDPEAPRTYDPHDPRGARLFMVIVCDIEKDGDVFRIATTHLPVTPHPGDADEIQRAAVGRLLAFLEQQGEFLICGDFNAPRPLETYQRFAARYKDNVPEAYITSLDRELHRVGHLDRMVDHMFTTPGYTVSHVEMVCGVSDHCALVAEVSKN